MLGLVLDENSRFSKEPKPNYANVVLLVLVYIGYFSDADVVELASIYAKAIVARIVSREAFGKPAEGL